MPLLCTDRAPAPWTHAVSLTDSQKVCLDHWIETNELDAEDEREARQARFEFLELIDLAYGSEC